MPRPKRTGSRKHRTSYLLSTTEISVLRDLQEYLYADSASETLRRMILLGKEMILGDGNYTPYSIFPPQIAPLIAELAPHASGRPKLFIMHRDGTEHELILPDKPAQRSPDENIRHVPMEFAPNVVQACAVLRERLRFEHDVEVIRWLLQLGERLMASRNTQRALWVHVHGLDTCFRIIFA